MPKDVTVESFELDHTIVKAPYVRLISEEVGPKGDIITNFDIRLIQPNENSIDTGGLHTIEHLLAKLIRQRIDGLIDCSPFGCRTGFHMIMWGKQDPTEIAKVIKSSLEAMQKFVGGNIECLPLCDLGAEFTLVCNDKGKLLELPPNRMLWGGADYLAGSGFIAGTDSEGNMTSLTAEEIAYYTEKYRAFLIAL